MSIVDYIKNMWYRESNDVYDSNDFDELFEMEEHDPSTKGQFINHAMKKGPIGYSQRFKENTNVIEHPAALTSQSEVVVIEPRSFDEALEIIEQLRCRRSVVLNLQYLDAEQSQRVVDFLSGATHALDGHQQRVGQGVFIFAPSNFVLNSDSNEARALKDAFWNRTQEREPEPTYQEYAEPVKKSSIF
jgi:cell division inhibitor SepF